MVQAQGFVEAIAARRAEVVAVVERDLTASAGLAGDLARDRAADAVDRLLSELARSEATSPSSLEALRSEAIDAARSGLAVGVLIDAHLSAGWAIWEVAVSLPGAAEALPRLGGTLLRAGDAAAAAIAASYAEAERRSAARGASARREFLDEVLALHAGDPVPARLLRRAPAYGLGPGFALRVVVAFGGRDLDDDDPNVAQLASALGPRVAIVATDRGRALLIGRTRAVGPGQLAGAFDAAFGPGTWAAATADLDATAGIGAVGGAAHEAHDTLDLLVRLGVDGRLEPVAAWRLERAILLDPVRLRAGIADVLGPVLHAPRTGPALLDTLRVFLETAGNRRETARRLGLAPRTVAYRLDRIAALTGARLAGPSLVRLAAALHAAAILGENGVSLPASAPGRSRRGASR